MPERKKRRCHSVKKELIAKSREAMLAAVQIYNNPNITFKTEIFIVLAVISWTYLLHAHYKQSKIKYVEKSKNKNGETIYRYWGLEKCLNNENCPLDKETKANLRFLIEIRHEIEHSMTGRIDECLIDILQACAVNFNYYIGELFGNRYKLNENLALAIQFSPISAEQQNNLQNNSHVTSKIRNIIANFESDLSEDIKNSPRYSYKICYLPILVNHPNQANEVKKFIYSDSLVADSVNIVRPKSHGYKPKEIVDRMKAEGYPKFNMHKHTELWKKLKAKDKEYVYGEYFLDTWGWYPKWIDIVRKYCQEHKEELQ